MMMKPMKIRATVHRCAEALAVMFAIILYFNAERSMRHGAQSFLGDEFARFATDAIGLFVNADESSLESCDEFLLALCHRHQLFL